MIEVIGKLEVGSTVVATFVVVGGGERNSEAAMNLSLDECRCALEPAIHVLLENSLVVGLGALAAIKEDDDDVVQLAENVSRVACVGHGLSRQRC